MAFDTPFCGIGAGLVVGLRAGVVVGLGAGLSAGLGAGLGAGAGLRAGFLVTVAGARLGIYVPSGWKHYARDRKTRTFVS